MLAGFLIVKLLLITVLRVFYAKMLGETGTKETMGSFVTFLSLVAFQLGVERAFWTPLTTSNDGGELLLKNGTINGYSY